MRYLVVLGAFMAVLFAGMVYIPGFAVGLALVALIFGNDK